ncbi:hypothetical protein DL767_007555 [Monosporascus sp. MG133]|nr:hypothetical protein DL767_007555 [Monosporascus sp. MG133]
MAPVRKRESSQSPTHSTPQRSPIKKTRRMGISLAQKQALIDNLQLEITERARRLRAQYNIQAQQLRSRVEMRINRIPTTLRKAKMGELFAKSSAESQQQQQQQQQQQPKPPSMPAAYAARPPPVPAKDGAPPQPIARKPLPLSKTAPPRGQKRLSEEMPSADKENQGALENPKKRHRGPPTAGAAAIQPGKVLSPASSNRRIIPSRERQPSPMKNMMERPASPTKSIIERPASPTKSLFGRPASPVKAPTTKTSSSNLLSSMVGRAKGTRGAATAARKVTTTALSSSMSSSAGSTTSSTRTKKAAAPPPPASTAAATTTRGKRKVSVISESSEGSTGTVVKKTAVSRAAKTTAAAPAAKRTVMGTIRSATTKKAAAAKPAASSTITAGGRTLRKR